MEKIRFDKISRVSEKWSKSNCRFYNIYNKKCVKWNRQCISNQQCTYYQPKYER